MNTVNSLPQQALNNDYSLIEDLNTSLLCFDTLVSGKEKETVDLEIKRIENLINKLSILDIISLYDVRFAHAFEARIKFLFENFNFNEHKQDEILTAYMMAKVTKDENCRSKMGFLDYYFEKYINVFSLPSLKKCKEKFNYYIPMFINDYICDPVINFFDDEDDEGFQLESCKGEPIDVVETSGEFYRQVAWLLSIEEVSVDKRLENLLGEVSDDERLEGLPNEFDTVLVGSCIGTMLIPKGFSILYPKKNVELKFFKTQFDDHCKKLKQQNLVRFKNNCGGSKKKALEIYQNMQIHIPDSQFAAIFDFEEITNYIDSLSVSRRFMSFFRKK